MQAATAARRPRGARSLLGRPIFAALCALGLTACGVSGPPHASPGLGRGLPTATTTTAATTTTEAAPTTTTDPGLLPQTDVEPPTGAPLQAQMQELWRAIIDGSEGEAMPLFFPRSAYLQMKTGVIPDPAADYADRLVAFYALDLSAYHALVDQQGAAPTLLSVLVDPTYASWIDPQTCENLIGYWHLPGVRLVYEAGGATYSFAVASLISWRGVWYVVHLGPNPRPENVGTVDQPASGPGLPGPPGGC